VNGFLADAVPPVAEHGFVPSPHPGTNRVRPGVGKPDAWESVPPEDRGTRSNRRKQFVGGLRKLRHRGGELVDWIVTFAATAYSLIRLRTLLGRSTSRANPGA
jgi:hypothetical protein